MRNKNVKTLLLATLLPFGMVLILISFFISQKTFDNDGTNLKNYEDLIPFKTNEIVNLTQNFIIKKESINQFSFLIKNTNQGSLVSINITKDSSDNPLLNETIEILPIESIQNIELSLSNYEFKKGDYQANLSFSANSDMEIYLVPANRYDQGKLSINNKMVSENVLAFQYNYVTSDLIILALDRITLQKPWVFGNTAGLIVIFIFYIIILFILALQLIKNNY